MAELSLRVFDCSIRVNCYDEASLELIDTCYSAFRDDAMEGDVALDYTIVPTKEGAQWLLRIGEEEIVCESEADLLYDFEKDMTIRAQELRADLFFMHAAAVYRDGKCIIIAGASGSGKSTLCWTLCNSGFTYLSDELAPIQLAGMRVVPYPHALCLKSRPESGADLPKSTIDTLTTLHVPTESLPKPPMESLATLSAMIFIVFDGARDYASIGEISRGEAAARLYSNALNQLAHEADGLPAARHIAESAPAFALRTGTVKETARIIGDLVDSL